jgi:hypothetical protein
MKRCKVCGETKSLSEFYKATGAADGHRGECKECNLARKKQWYAANRDAVISKVKKWQADNRDRHNAYQREYRRANAGAMREGHLKRTFGITQADYDALLEAQGGGCAICGKAPGKISLHVDHDHETGEIRGLLCVGCNNALGQFHDDPRLLVRAIDYVDDDLLPSAEELQVATLTQARASALTGVFG